MALLGTIRNRFGWVMMGLIFVGIGSFLFMDASGPGSKLGNSSSKVGSVNGEKITRDELSEGSQSLQGQGMLQQEIDKNVWDNIVVEKLINQKATEAGFDVTADEMGELFLSEDPRIQSSLVAQQFRNQTGQVDYERIRQALTTFKSRSNIISQYQGEQQQQLLNQYDVWKNLEESVYNRRLQNKYFNALDIGFYTPDWMVETENNIRYATYSFEYASIPYAAIEGEGDVTDAEINAYIEANARQYKRDATIGVDYVTFDVVPTSADSTAIYNELEATADEFRKEKDDTLFVDSRDGQFAADYYTKEDLPVPTSLKDSMMAADKGTVFGPFLEEGQYTIVKAIDSKILPDSVKARQILIPGNTQQQLIAARDLLDSLKKVLEDDATVSFDSLTAKHSRGPNAQSGGDIGWTGMSNAPAAAPLEQYLFFSGKKDSLAIIFTQQGAHLIQITDYKFETNDKGLRIAVISQNIIPSTETLKAVKRKVNDFIYNNNSSDKMRAAAQERGMQVGSASGLTPDDYEIDGLGKNSATAAIIEWGHEENTKEGMVNPSLLGIDNEELNYTKQYVVASITTKSPEGLASAKDPIVKAQVDRILRNKKKAAIVNKKLSEANTLQGIASAYGADVRTASAIQFDNAKISPTVTEPKVVALAAATPNGQLSKAIAGNEGVYVVQPTNKTEAPTVADIKTTRQSINRVVTGAVSSKILDDMKEDADIVDKRNEF